MNTQWLENPRLCTGEERCINYLKNGRVMGWVLVHSGGQIAANAVSVCSTSAQTISDAKRWVETVILLQGGEA